MFPSQVKMSKSLRLCAIAGSLVFFFLALADSSYGQVTSVNGQIAYTVCGPGTDPQFSTQCDIWVMQADGTLQTNLTNTLDLNETNPAWSPDGSKIAFMEGYEFSTRLMVMNADGSNSTVITPDPSFQFYPSWSPAGTQIALVRQLPGETITIQFDIVILNADGSSEINITHSDFDEIDPAWAPDGSKIAFAGVRPEMTTDPDTGDVTEAAQWEIVSVNPDGSGEQVLSAGDPGSPRSLLLEEDRNPAWSPDSSRLVFASQLDDPCCDNWKILIMNRDGTGITLLSDNPLVNDFAPSFSPDGTLILFTSDRDATVGGEFDIYSIPVPPAFNVPLKSTANRLTNAGHAGDANWGRKDAPAPSSSRTLFVTIPHQGKKKGGKVASSPKGIKCGHDCSQSYATNLQVTLTAKPGKRYLFSGWLGACAHAGTAPTCVVTVDDSKVAGAAFTKKS